jgi:phasin family protein
MSTTDTTTPVSGPIAAPSFVRAKAELKEGATQAAAGFEQAQATIRTSMEKAMKTTEELISFNQGNFEAVARASQAFATGLQDMTQYFAATAKASMEETVSTYKAIATAKSVKEAMELQTKLVRGLLDKAVSHNSQLADATIKLSEQTLAPLTARVSLATQVFSFGA